MLKKADDKAHVNKEKISVFKEIIWTSSDWYSSNNIIDYMKSYYFLDLRRKLLFMFSSIKALTQWSNCKNLIFETRNNLKQNVRNAKSMNKKLYDNACMQVKKFANYLKNKNINVNLNDENLILTLFNAASLEMYKHVKEKYNKKRD